MDPKDPVITRTSLGEKFDKDSFSDKQIEGLACAISVYVSVFSRPPFAEEWTVEEGDDYLQQFSDSEDDFDPHNATHLFRLIDALLVNPESVFLTTEGEEEILEIISDEETLARIRMIYPFSSILKAYARDSKDPKSMVLVSYHDANDKQQTIDLTEESPGEIVSPRGVTRVRYMGSNIGDQIFDEIGYYIPEEMQEELRALIDEVPTTYLGEIAVTKESRFMMESIIRAAKKFSPLPDQFIMFTKEGSATIRTAEEEDRLLSLFSKVLYQNKKLTLTRKGYRNEEGQNVFVNIYKVKDERPENNQ